MKAIVNAKLILIDSIVWDGCIVFDKSGIKAAGAAKEVDVSGCELIDAGGNYVGPGLVDIHTHGGGGHWFHLEPEGAARHFLSHGETTVLPALYFDLSLEEYLAGIAQIREARKSGAARIIEGLNMEGPYMNPRYGCNQELNKWKGVITREAYMPLLEAGHDLFKIHCVAPEREGIEGYVRDAAAATPGVVFSMAHSEAYPAQIWPLLRYGLKLTTHWGDATGAVVRYPEVRGVGIDEAAMIWDDIYTELICDSRGVHVDPWMLRMVVNTKGRNRVILISDSTEFDGPLPTTFEPAPDLKYDYDEGIAGSCLTLDMACRNMMAHTGAGLCDVFRYASYNPAKLMGMEYEIGQLIPGSRANMIIVDDTMDVKKVIFAGETV